MQQFPLQMPYQPVHLAFFLRLYIRELQSIKVAARGGIFRHSRDHHPFCFNDTLFIFMGNDELDVVEVAAGFGYGLNLHFFRGWTKFRKRTALTEIDHVHFSAFISETEHYFCLLSELKPEAFSLLHPFYIVGKSQPDFTVHVLADMGTESILELVPTFEFEKDVQGFGF